MYRARNAERVAALVAMARPLGLRPMLWALDSVRPEFAAETLGCGPGSRVELLNRLWAAASGERTDLVVVADDDIEFVRGDLAALLRTVERAGFDLAQPAHAAGSHASHQITRRRRLSVARRTDFVEIGPLHVVRRPWIGRILPMPDGFGMGYGLDLLWQDLAAEGCRMGIVDAVTVLHPPPSHDTYDTGPEIARLSALLEERGLEAMWHAQHVLGTWRPWHSHAPWQAERTPA